MTAPIHLLIALWYHCSGTGLDYEAGTPHGESGATAECTRDLVAVGLLKENYGEAAVNRRYEPTDGLAVWIDALCAVPYPILKWASPNVPRNPDWAPPLHACIHCKQKPCACTVAQSATESMSP